MNSIKPFIPNTITAGNLVCGCLAILSLSKGNFASASWFIITAGFFDFIDGFVARLLKVNSDLGKQLDSLADVVTFGVAPGLMIYFLLSKTTFCEEGSCWKAAILPYYGLLIPIFSALRLAKFNIDPRQSGSFIGVPTPANGLMIACFALTPETSFFYPIFHHHIFLTFVAVGMSYLLIAEIPLLAIKFKNFSWNENRSKYLLILSSLILIALLGFAAAPFILILYVILSQINNQLLKNNL